MTTVRQLIDYLDGYDDETVVEFLSARGPISIDDAVLHESIDNGYSKLYLTSEIDEGELANAQVPFEQIIDWDIQPPKVKDTEAQEAKVRRYTKSDLFNVIAYAVERADPDDSVSVVVDELHKFLTTGKLPE